jgi:hypothetical protein
MAYRATPQTTTKYSPFYLIHGREINLPTMDKLKAKISVNVQDVDLRQKLENLKSNLSRAYKVVRGNNRRAHQKNKSYYDKKAKLRTFEVDDKVYLFCPAKKAGVCNKFRCVWKGPYIVKNKLSDLNYQIVDSQGKELIVNVNRLKKSYEQSPMEVRKKKSFNRKVRPIDDSGQEEEVRIRSHPIPCSLPPDNSYEVVQEGNETMEFDVEDSPAGRSDSNGRGRDSIRMDPDYIPSDSPRSRRELGTSPYSPPMTRSRARLQFRDDMQVEYSN